MHTKISSVRKVVVGEGIIFSININTHMSEQNKNT